MKRITKNDLNELNSQLINSPMFSNYTNKEKWLELLNTVLEELYITEPQEILDYFDSLSTEKMQDVMIRNYGISKEDIDPLPSFIKKDIVFFLEELTSKKGTPQVFNLFSRILDKFFNNMNIYNVVVLSEVVNKTKEPYYALSPIHINDNRNILGTPEINPDNLNKNRADIPSGETFITNTYFRSKYLMQLEQYKSEKMFPIFTNIIYIQFISASEIINNFNTPNNIARAYAFLNYRDITFEFEVNNSKVLFNGKDFEYLMYYLKIEYQIIKDNTKTYKDFNAIFEKNVNDSKETLIHYFNNTFDDTFVGYDDDKSFLKDLLDEYSNMNFSNIEEFKNFRRRYDLFLKTRNINRAIPSDNDADEKFEDYNFKDVNALRTYITNKYKIFIDEFINLAYQSNDNFSEFLLKFMQVVKINLNEKNDKYITDIIDAFFLDIYFHSSDYINLYFLPIFKLMIKYFFPIESDYYLEEINKEIFTIKDKENCISTGTKSFSVELTTNNFSFIKRHMDNLDSAEIYKFNNSDGVSDTNRLNDFKEFEEGNNNNNNNYTLLEHGIIYT